MATRKRDIPLGKEKAKSPAQTPATKLKATTNQPTKPNVSTVPQKKLSSIVRPTTKTTSTNVSRPQAKKTASISTTQKPTKPKPKPIAKTLSSIQKTNVSPNASPRSSLSGKTASPRTSLSGKTASPRTSISGKIVDSQKSVYGKTLNSQKPVPSKVTKTPAKEVGKQATLHATPLSNVKKSSTVLKKRESGSGLPARKEQIACVPHEKIENPSIPSVLEVETQVQDQEQETCLAQVEQREAQVDVKCTDDQESSSFEKTEAEINQEDVETGTSATPSTLEHEDTPLDTKRQEEEDMEEQSENETNNYNKGEDFIATDNLSHEGAKEEEEEKVEKEVETASMKKDDVVENTSDGEREVETKKETEKAAPKPVERVHGKKDVALSNDVIEETASKLREQRKNKVRALAGAFETVISLQEK